ncbi:MAG: hypothetical protein IT243_02240 [Bacteroidia bacterium]|nr:hypothetical protein [Bacteroidia bacterium]
MKRKTVKIKEFFSSKNENFSNSTNQNTTTSAAYELFKKIENSRKFAL